MPIFGVEMTILQAKIDTLAPLNTPVKNKIPKYTGCLKQSTISSTHNETAKSITKSQLFFFNQNLSAKKVDSALSVYRCIFCIYIKQTEAVDGNKFVSQTV